MGKDLCNAIKYLPEKFITEEMASAAAKEHDAELLTYLPKRFITPQIIEEVFAGGMDKYYWRCDLNKIPEQYRTEDICRKAIKCSTDNIMFVPSRLIDKEMVGKIIYSSHFFELLHLIPQHIWDVELIYQAMQMLINKKDEHTRYGNPSIYTAKTMQCQIVLSFVPQEIKTAEFYLGLFDGKINHDIIIEITPSRFKTENFYMLLAKKGLSYIPNDKLSYNVLASLFSEDSTTWRLNDALNNETCKLILTSVIDEKLADKIIIKHPENFRDLPDQFQTEARLILAVREKAKGRNSWNDFRSSNYSEDLLTEKVVKEFIKYGTQCNIPMKFWDQKLAQYCLEHGKANYFWFQQMPKSLQTKEIVNTVIASSEYYLECALKKFISKKRAVEIMRSRIKDNSSNELRDLPTHYFSDFEKQTGLPHKFMGGKVGFADVKDDRKNYTYCKLGNLYIGFYNDGTSYRPSYSLIITRAEKGAVPKELYNYQLGTFHKTWLEKIIADNDIQFTKPFVDPSLKDVQAVSYYGVEFIEQTDGFNVYRNTFCGITIGHCVKKEGLTYHSGTINHAMNGWEEKNAKMQESEGESNCNDYLDRTLTAACLHRKYNFCETGMAAFVDDYGLDYKGRYTVRDLRAVVSLVGHKPSVQNYRRELKRIHVI